MDSFTRYVPFEVVSEMMRSGKRATIQTEMHEVTVFFSDIADFTSICEKMELDPLNELMKVYFTAMVRILLGANGTIIVIGRVGKACATARAGRAMAARAATSSVRACTVDVE